MSLSCYRENLARWVQCCKWVCCQSLNDGRSRWYIYRSKSAVKSLRKLVPQLYTYLSLSSVTMLHLSLDTRKKINRYCLEYENFPIFTLSIWGHSYIYLPMCVVTKWNITSTMTSLCQAVAAFENLPVVRFSTITSTLRNLHDRRKESAYLDKHLKR